MNSCEWAATITALAVAIAKNHTQEEIAFLSLLFGQLGTTLATISAQPPAVLETET